MRQLTAFGLVACLLPSLIYSHAVAEEPTEQQVRTLTGQVLLPDGSPAVNAVLRKTPHTSRSDEFRTDAEGKYQITFPKRSSLRAIFAKSADGLYGNLWQVSDEELSETVTLKPLRSFEVKVIGNDQEPIPGASVYLQSGDLTIDRQVTDDNGTVTVRSPVGIPLETVGAVKRGVGSDYLKFEHDSETTHSQDLPQDVSGSVTLKLTGIREVTVKVISSNPDLIKGIHFYSRYITKPDRKDRWYIAGMPEFFGVTNAEGIAVFDAIPRDMSSSLMIYPRGLPNHLYYTGGYFGCAFFDWAKDNTVNETTIEVQEKVLVGGTIKLPNGEPAANVKVHASGGFNVGSGFRESAMSNEQGHWNLLVKPNGYYMFVIEDQTYAAEAHSGIFVLDHGAMLKVRKIPATEPGGKEEQMLIPAPPLDFTLQPAMKVYGKVTGVVSENMSIYLGQEGDSYYDLAEEFQILNVEGNTRAIMSTIGRNAVVQPNGTYEFTIGLGNYWISNPQRSKSQKFTIDNESKEFNFEMKRPLTGPAVIRVLNGDNQEPLQNVIIKSRGLEDSSRSHWGGATDKDGQLKLKRPLESVLVVAISEDKEWTGFARMGADDKELTITLKPAVTVTGQVVDALKSPLADFPLEVGIQVKTPNGMMSNITNHKVKTDADGKFSVSGLCQDIEHMVHQVNLDDKGKIKSWNQIKSFTPTETTVDLKQISRHR